MTNDTLDFVTQKLLDQAKLMGADEADVIATKGQSLNVDVRQGALENADRAEGTEVGLRVLVSKRQAIVSSSDISEDTLQLMVERAIAMAKDAPEDKYAGLANVDQLTKETDLFGLEICDPAAEPSPSKLQEEAERAEASALQVSGVSKVSDASASYGKYSVFMAASNGFTANYERSSHSVSCVAIAGEGSDMERDYDADTRDILPKSIFVILFLFLMAILGWQQIIKNNLYGGECIAKAEDAKKSNFADQLKLLQNNADTIESEGGDGGTGSTNEYNDIFGDPNLFKNFGGFDN